MSETRTIKGRLEVRQSVDGDATLIRLSGAIDEAFSGFDPVSTSTVVVELSGLQRITSYGVRQWIRARDSLAVKNLYYVNCPPSFIDQLNMVLNFGGAGQVVTAFAPFSCVSCRAEQWAPIDVLARHDELIAGRVSIGACPKCSGQLEMDELPETYFGFVRVNGARALNPAAATLLATSGLYNKGGVASEGATTGERAAVVTKLVHDRVTYFRIEGQLDKRFRSRSLLDGTEGEVVLDLRQLGGVAADGRDEWDRLRSGLRERASVVTVVDVPPPVLDAVQKGLSLDGTVVYSIIAPHKCDGCGRGSDVSILLGAAADPKAKRVCSACGGNNRFAGNLMHLDLAKRLPTGPILAASREVIDRRDDLLSRARIDAEAAAPTAAGAKGAGAILGKYEIVRALSVGGMAEVFLAVQKGIGGFEKPVALKRIRRSVLERRHFAVEQFLNEAKIAATLTHPNIAQTYDVGEEDGVLYLAMEFVHGKDLRVLAKRIGERGVPFPLGAALYLVGQVARALHHAYTATDLSGRQLKAVHRDVSPHNILVAFDGSVKLVDFGVATSAATQGDDPTAPLGKRPYLSPEQLQGHPLDARSDLYSLGVVLYELLSGERPFAHDSREALLAAINEGKVAALSARRPDLPAGIDALMKKLLAASPSARFSDGGKLADELQRFAEANAATVGAEWVRTTMGSLFPKTGEAEPDAGPGHRTETPHSTSFSLTPTNEMARLPPRPVAPAPTPVAAATATPIDPLTAAAPKPAPVAGKPAVDASAVSNLVAAPPPRGRSLWLLACLVAAAIAATMLWLRY